MCKSFIYISIVIVLLLTGEVVLQYFEIKKVQLLSGSKNSTVIQICKLCITLTVSRWQ